VNRKRFFWKLYIPILLITILSLTIIIFYIFQTLKEFYYKQIAEELTSKALLLEQQLSSLDIKNSKGEIQNLCKKLGEKTKTRITIILPDGSILSDSHSDPLNMENHSDRPEIIEAFNGKIQKTIRLSPTLKKKMMYIAIPFKREGTIRAVIRTSLSIDEIEKELHSLNFNITTSSLVIVIIFAVVIFILTRQIIRPLEEMKNYAELFAKGELGTRIPPSTIYEINALSEILNNMASELDKRIKSATEQRNQIEAVLSSMEEGVLALDARKRVLTINDSAIRLLKIETDEPIGKNIQEITRKIDILRFIDKIPTARSPVEENILISDGRERILKLHGSILNYGKRDEYGVLIVLNDITRIQQLENIRKDFVSNVSHELKTPITSIKGFVETLIDGALKNKEDLKRFLDIIQKHATRLDAIIDDLLTLSRLEEEDTKDLIQFKETKIIDVVTSSMDICRMKAKEKEIAMHLNCPPNIKAEINPPLIEEALINLIDNAIKFSPNGSKIEISAREEKGEIRVKVRDYGCGIPEEHLPRLAERFYRVDKSRSRKIGGTGLGLSIVKHIIQLHAGKIHVESEMGKGSTFSIHMPAKI